MKQSKLYKIKFAKLYWFGCVLSVKVLLSKDFIEINYFGGGGGG